jgi:hypothetical protein
MMGEHWEQFEEQFGNLLGTYEELLVEFYVSSWCPKQSNKTWKYKNIYNSTFVTR